MLKIRDDDRIADVAIALLKCSMGELESTTNGIPIRPRYCILRELLEAHHLQREVVSIASKP